MMPKFILKDLNFIEHLQSANVGIKHASDGATENRGRRGGFQQPARDLTNVHAMKTMFDHYYCVY